MSVRQIQTALQALLGNYAAQPLMANVANDLYEAYLFAIVIDAAQREQATIEYRDGNDRSTQQLWFRRSPGVLHGSPTFTHAHIQFSNREALEVHVGIRVNGVSQIAHECDVAILRKSECDRSRADSLLPRSRSLILALEAKYYSVPLPLGLGRSLLGLDKEFFGTSIALATNIRSDDILAMILHHKAYANHEILPGGHAHESLTHFIAEIFHRFRYRR